MENREIFLKKMEAQTKEWEANLKHLQARAANLDADAHIEYEKHIHNLKEQLKKVERHSNRFRDTNDDSWHNLGDDIKNGWDDLVTNIDNAISRFKK